MFDHTSWIWLACSVGIRVPKSRPTSSYLSPRHFMAASTMSGSWPMILLGLFGSRYMIGGSVGSSPTFRVLPANPGYLVPTLSGSQAACADPTAPTPTAAATIAASNTPVQYLMPGLPSSREAVHCSGARYAPVLVRRR